MGGIIAISDSDIGAYGDMVEREGCDIWGRGTEVR